MKVSLGSAVLAASIVTLCSAASATATPPAPIVVHIKNFKYVPTPLTVHAGDTVAFINDDDEVHTVTAADKSFDSQGLDSNATWKHTFASPGTFAYFCGLHPFMKGTVVALAAEQAR